jgi:Kef-type K+ transport system membrane component KefB
MAVIFAVIALKLAAAYLAAWTVGFDSRDARAIGALMQCGGVMTIALSLESLHAHVIDTRMHATLTVIGLATTIAAGTLLPRTWCRHRVDPAMARFVRRSLSGTPAFVPQPNLYRNVSVAE